MLGSPEARTERLSIPQLKRLVTKNEPYQALLRNRHLPYKRYTMAQLTDLWYGVKTLSGAYTIRGEKKISTPSS